MTTRRWLIQGLNRDQLKTYLTSYEQLEPPDKDTFYLPLRGPGERGWVQIDVPMEVPLYHFHNMAVWFEGAQDGDPTPGQVLAFDHGGTGPYWLKPARGVPMGNVLHGCRDDRSHYVFDLAQMGEVNHPKWRATPMSIKMAMMTHKVPSGWHDPDKVPLIDEHVPWRPWQLDRPGASPILVRALSWFLGKR